MIWSTRCGETANFVCALLPGILIGFPRRGNVTAGAAVRVLRAGPVELGPSLTLAAGSAYGEALRIDRPRAVQRLPWIASLFGLQLRIHLDSFALRVAAEFGLCFVQPRYTIDDYGEVFRAESLFGRLGLGVAWTFL